MPQGLVITNADGRTLDQIKSWSLRAEYSEGPDEFTATIYHHDISQLRLLELQAVDITLEGTPQLSGRIERTITGGDGTTVQVYGRDFRGDMDACHVDPTFRVTKSESLAAVILRVSSVVGITEVKATGDFDRRSVLSGALPGSRLRPVGYDQAKTDDFKPQAGESIWTFVRRLGARFGCTIQAGERGVLIISRPAYEKPSIYSIARSIGDGGNNNVVNSSSDRNYRDVPTYAVVAGKQWKNKGKDSGVVWSEGPVVLGRAGAINVRIKPGEERPGKLTDAYRLMFKRADEARTQEEVDLLFNRAVSEEANHVLHYRVDLEGWADAENGHTWTIDTMVDVADDVADVYRTLWVHSRELKYTQDGGPSTSLECWIPEAFNLVSPGPDTVPVVSGAGKPSKPSLFARKWSHIKQEHRDRALGYLFGFNPNPQRLPKTSSGTPQVRVNYGLLSDHSRVIDTD